MTTRQRQGAGSPQTAAYRALIAIAEEVVASARMALDDTAAMRGKDPLTALNIKALREEIAHYCALGAGVIGQARRRVLDGEQVPTSEKIYSIFEPHTDLIKRGKVLAPVEFGHKPAKPTSNSLTDRRRGETNRRPYRDFQHNYPSRTPVRTKNDARSSRKFHPHGPTVMPMKSA